MTGSPFAARAFPRDDDGFSLLEVLVALVLTLLVLSTALWLLATQTTLAESLPYAADLRERGRVAAALLASDLGRAGAGPASGRLAGPLPRVVPAIVPRRLGLSGADVASAARSDAFTVIWAADPRHATETAAPVAGDTPALSVVAAPNCARVTLCGLAAGTKVLIADESGRSGLYVITATNGATADLRALQSSPPAFGAGAVVLAVESRTYVFDAAARQLRSYDAYLSDIVVVDDVVGMEVAYLGDDRRPPRPKPQAGTANCAFDAAGTFVAAPEPVPLEGASLAPLPLSVFADGPWCGEGGRAFDVDLLRVRAVRVRLRLEAARDPFRGQGARFVRPGTNSRPLGLVPDFTIAMEVTPSNLNTGR